MMSTSLATSILSFLRGTATNLAASAKSVKLSRHRNTVPNLPLKLYQIITIPVFYPILVMPYPFTDNPKYDVNQGPLNYLVVLASTPDQK